MVMGDMWKASDLLVTVDNGQWTATIELPVKDGKDHEEALFAYRHQL